MLKVLVACEYTQVVTIALRKMGIEAYSCDIRECIGGHPEWHIQGDVVPLLYKEWDMIIAFPPCDHLAVSGAAHFKEKIADGRQAYAIAFFLLFTKLKCKKVAIENPKGIMSTVYRKPDQNIQPFQFGDPYKKTTFLWLKGLPPLKKSRKNRVGQGLQRTQPSGCTSPKWFDNRSMRDRTFDGIANAMAQQWGKILLDEFKPKRIKLRR
jgi:site-specific DNA-cytosine methylase